MHLHMHARTIHTAKQFMRAENVNCNYPRMHLARLYCCPGGCSSGGSICTSAPEKAPPAQPPLRLSRQRGRERGPGRQWAAAAAGVAGREAQAACPSARPRCRWP